MLDMKKQKKKDYKSIVEEIQNEGQEFDTQSDRFSNAIGTPSNPNIQVFQRQASLMGC